jgi:hypothetical protein
MHPVFLEEVGIGFLIKSPYYEFTLLSKRCNHSNTVKCTIVKDSYGKGETAENILLFESWSSEK